MKEITIFINLGEDIVARNIFTDDFLKNYLSDNSVRNVVLVQLGKKEFFESRLPKGLIIEEYKRGKTSKIESLLNSLSRSGINSHTNLWSKMRSYKRGDSGLVDTLWKRSLAATLGNFDWYKKMLRYFLLKISPDDRLKSLFDTYNPSLLFATSLSNYDFDVPIAREAKRRNIKVVGMGRSWDNFSSHGLLRVVPDEFLLQNPFLLDMAEEYQAIYKKDVPMTVVGLPHYDPVAKLSEVLESREKFLPRLGLNTNEKYVLYGAMGEFLFIHEKEMPDILENIMETGSLKINKMIYRAHPKFKITPPQKPYKHLSFDTTGDYATGAKDGLDDNAYLINSIYHSELLITPASTMAVDSCVLDKPFVCVAFDGSTPESEVDHFESVKRFYDLYTHYEDFIETSKAKVAYSKEELCDMANKYLADSSLDKENRHKAMERFAFKLDGLASKRISDYLKNKIKDL